MYICQLSKSEKLQAFKRIKSILIANDCFTIENVRIALDSKLSDL